jgi:uncharacterized membrane protein
VTFQSSMMWLRLVHILAGTFWVGSAVTFAGFVYPAVRASGPAGPRVMRQLMEHRRLTLGFSISAALTVVSGVAMYAVIGVGGFRAWVSSPMGMTLGVGAIAALAAACIGSGVAAPAGRRLQALSSSMATETGTPSPEHLGEIARVQARLGHASVASAVLLTVAAAAMATARYV